MSIDLIKQLEAGETLDIRADGKAGCGLVMILQTFAQAVSMEGTYTVQEWPLFSSARKGANVRGFLRIAKGNLSITCQTESPSLALLVTEKTGEELDFSSGMPEGLFIINTSCTPAEAARKFNLKGLVITVPADRLSQEYLGHSIPNIPVLAALQKTVPLVSIAQIIGALRTISLKRRLPERVIQANEACFVASLKSVRSERFSGKASHPIPSFQGYENYPVAAQSRLRTSLTNQTANYARAGRRLLFKDPLDRCTGCSLCIVNCPEGIIRYEPDPKRGIRVTGADTNQFCKLCRECIEACPIDLFDEVGIAEIEPSERIAL